MKQWYALYVSLYSYAMLLHNNHYVKQDDVIKMETFSALLAFYAGNSPVTGEFPA